MRRVLPIALLCAVAAFAQRGGGMGGARGGMGGGARGGMGGARGGIGGGRVGMGSPGMGRGPAMPIAPSVGFGRGHRGGSAFAGWNYGGWGLGYGWGWGIGNYGCPYSYPCSTYVGAPYIGNYPYFGAWSGYYDAVPAYSLSYAQPQPQSQPSVTVVYPPPVERANPVIREYDDSGREVQSRSISNASPVYLFAFEDKSIQAASSYRVDGSTLHFVTLRNEARQAPVDTLDRALTLQLNRERGVGVRLP